MEKPSTCVQDYWMIVMFMFAISPSQSFDYRDALSKSILYFEAQRSGHLPIHQRVFWRHHSGITDGWKEGVDLVGGYYDAGDNIKFGLPMAFTITMLSWSVMQYEEELYAAGELQHALEAIKWGTDYLLKAHSHPNVLWVQVGDESDHECWQRPEDMNTSRRAYKVDEKHPGSEVAGETAAAMASASIVFKDINPYYSSNLIDHAIQLFEFGEKFRGDYDESVKAVRKYYPSTSGYTDELLWAALWLYRATRKAEYLHYALQNAESFRGTTWAIKEFSWDIKFAGVQLIAAMLPKEEKEEHNKILQDYRFNAEFFICAQLNKNEKNSNNVPRTPAGLLYTRDWNPLQYASAATFLLMVYSDHLKDTNQKLKCTDKTSSAVSAEEIFAVAKTQVDYILGSNPRGMSYLVGFSSHYPKQVHHRGASIEGYEKNKGSIECFEGYHKWFNRKGPNPNVLVGAIVGGPDADDQYSDHRGNFNQAEACTYNTAPLVGIFAKLNAMENQISVDVFPVLIHES